ncbi:hypothetical protein Patl1_14837 [Pistacia atlantica]|uniref:Uncharacterized protein n=1 Tax=Pistacia atlantica TaxID=434234 RepID=A0ACC1AXU3_9ROSI|nr:hypothetical protein Patl1_14837 [Pistacia atlantica]
MMLFEKIYLVESEGSLLAITREGVHVRPIYEGSEICCYGTYGFRVFEVNFESDTCEEVKNLGNNTVFVGDNSSFSVKASEVMGYKPNSIYFTNDCWESYLGMDEEEKLEMTMMDMGIYMMEDGRIEPHFKGTSISYITPRCGIEGEVDHILSRL